MKYTHNDFIRLANIKHFNSYDYSKVQYSKGSDKICIICPTHGEFIQLASSHLSGRGCKGCYIENIKVKRTLTTSLFLEKCMKLANYNNYTYENVNYITSKDKVDITCKKHGYFKIQPNMFLRGVGCKKCHFEKKTLTYEDFINKCNLKLKLTYDFSKVNFKNTKTKVDVICPHKHIFTITPANLLAGHGCPHCNNEGGYKLNKKGYLYLLKIEKENSIYYKIGITNNINSRIRKIKYKSIYPLMIIKMYNSENSKDIVQIELDIKSTILSEMNLSREEFKDGWTETFPESHLSSVNSIIEGYVKSNKLKEEFKSKKC